ncbi:lipoprotein-anchoring transpeptidase ErfK/SrfK [Aurantimonas endophytica]|uniref:Lipoprotein-anchoring transpeptidase ErfK/SrfK n=2 Tax=Aurantimonas endophytica TaxID=1522175 RepID=A0A7W6HHW6_9HYPH|nr:lipoprotein-anchoring transpeptidase ErfK/SrfK [Aurantimonas endophytica]
MAGTVKAAQPDDGPTHRTEIGIVMKIKSFLLVGVAVASIATMAGCASSQRASLQPSSVSAAYTGPDGLQNGGSMAAASALGYGGTVDDGYTLPPIPTQKIDPQYLRQRVTFEEGREHAPGTVVVDTPNRFLYVVEPDGMAMRYGIGVGKTGFSWAGEANIRNKQHWPKWFPPAEMIDRKPELEPYRQGMDPGLQNPLGARALYLHQGGKDTLFRLHGTPEWWTIGTAASSGCIRLMNQDIIDLYERVPMDAKVVVRQGAERLAAR